MRLRMNAVPGKDSGARRHVVRSRGNAVADVGVYEQQKALEKMFAFLSWVFKIRAVDAVATVKFIAKVNSRRSERPEASRTLAAADIQILMNLVKPDECRFFVSRLADVSADLDGSGCGSAGRMEDVLETGLQQARVFALRTPAKRGCVMSDFQFIILTRRTIVAIILSVRFGSPIRRAGGRWFDPRNVFAKRF